MLAVSLKLHNYRSYTDESFEFDPRLTLIQAPNAHGKTNLLEALYFASTGRGIYEDAKEELIHFGEKDMYVVLSCRDGENGTRDGDGANERVFKAGIHTLETGAVKHFMVQTNRKGMYSYTRETPPVVLFSPSFMNIIEGSPSKRRVFVDVLLCRIDIEYKKRLRNYENAIRKRNKIIEKERDEGKLREALHFWDTYLIEQADYIVAKRSWLAEYMNSTPLEHMGHTFTLKYIPRVMSGQTLEESFEKQYYQRRTLVGPQRDEFRIIKDKQGVDVDVHTYASRGEQRLALLWLIIHQLNLYASHLESPPILLLDDILSELDDDNKTLIQNIVGKYQTIVTSAEEIPEEVMRPGKVIHLVK